jgi:hypothetical protein
MALVPQLWYTVDDAVNPTIVWSIGGLFDNAAAVFRQDLTVQVSQPYNINAIKPILITANLVNVTTLPAQQQAILTLFSFDGTAKNLYKAP